MKRNVCYKTQNRYIVKKDGETYQSTFISFYQHQKLLTSMDFNRIINSLNPYIFPNPFNLLICGMHVREKKHYTIKQCYSRPEQMT